MSWVRLLSTQSSCLYCPTIFLSYSANKIIGTSGRRCSRSPLGGRLAMTLVDRYFHHYSIPFFFSVATFSHRRSAWIKKLIQPKWLEMAKNLGFDPFPDPVGHFWATWRPFWIQQAVSECPRRRQAGIFFTFSLFSPLSRPFLIEGVLGSKNLFSQSGWKWPITQS